MGQMQVDRRIRTVLLVDDEPEICTLLCAMLRRSGATCIMAHSLAEGRAALQQGHLFDAAFLDANLPDGMGYHLIPEIKAKNDSTACVAISAMDAESDNARAAGADSFIPKPFSRTTIMGSLRLLGFNT